MKKLIVVSGVLGWMGVVSLTSAAERRDFVFDGPRVNAPVGAVKISEGMPYSEEKGYGWSLVPEGGKAGCFSVRLPEGTYQVTLLIGDTKAAKTTIKTECRQLQAENITTGPDEYMTFVMAVNIRTPRIAGSERGVGLKKNEGSNPRWDDKLTIEVNSPGAERSPLRLVSIVPVPEMPVVYLVGDSTVCDQPGEPYNSWGQMLPRWLQPTVAVANHAESGESFKSFLGERRWDKILTTLKAGDFVLIQMGHNDQKIKEENYARTGYTENATKLVREARQKGAIPVIVTSPERQRFEGGKAQDSLGDFPAALRDVAKAEGVPLIELTTATKTLYEAFGPPPASDVLFAPKDKTHHNNFGSYLISQIVAKEIQAHVPELAKHLRSDLPVIDVTKPPKFETFHLPVSPEQSTTRPAGS